MKNVLSEGPIRWASRDWWFWWPLSCRPHSEHPTWPDLIYQHKTLIIIIIIHLTINHKPLNKRNIPIIIHPIFWSISDQFWINFRLAFDQFLINFWLIFYWFRIKFFTHFLLFSIKFDWLSANFFSFRSTCRLALETGNLRVKFNWILINLI